MSKIFIEEVNSVGITLNKFEVIPSSKEGKSRSRIYIYSEQKILGCLKIYDDETVKFTPNDED
jgi:hypothetical protein